MRRLGPIIALALVVLLAVALRGRQAASATATATATPTAASSATPTPTQAATRTPSTAGATSDNRLIFRGVTVRDLDGRVAWRGDVDLRPVLARIQRGEKDAHRDDGTVFGNREHRLPERPRGWYREYVVRTPGLHGPGPQRLVVGKDGEAFYTSDHYATFTEVRGAHDR